MSNVIKDKRFSVRKAVACETLEYGIKPTARRFNMSKNSVRTLMKRFQIEGNDGLMARKSGPKYIPHKTSTTVKDEIVAIRKLVPCYILAKAKESSSSYAGVKQRWIVIFSQAAYDRECKTLSNNFQKGSEKEIKAFEKLTTEVFSCPKDAEKHLEKFVKVLKYTDFVGAKIIEVKKHATVGGPKKPSNLQRLAIKSFA